MSGDWRRLPASSLTGISGYRRTAFGHPPGVAEPITLTVNGETAKWTTVRLLRCDYSRQTPQPAASLYCRGDPDLRQNGGMGKLKHKRTPKTILRLPDLEHSKTAVLNSLTSSSSRRSYEHAIREFTDWYCCEPRLAFNKTVVTRYRIFLEQEHYAAATINLRLAAVRRLAYEASDTGLLSPDLTAASDA